MKFYYLWHKNLSRLAMNIDLIGKRDIVVVINTLDEEAAEQAAGMCDKKGVEHYITESNGKPAKGKNSVLQLFLESDNDYMVQLDGDDQLTRFGIDFYKRLAYAPFPPDMMVLYRQVGFNRDGSICYPFDKSDYYPEYDRLVNWFTESDDYDLDPETIDRWAKDRIEFDELMFKKSEDKEHMCRMVFYSRKAAGLMHFNENLIVGEDTYQFMQIKQMALKNELYVVRRKERNQPTYMYDNGHQSVTRSFSQQWKYDWSWIRPLLTELGKLDLPPDYARLPEFISIEKNFFQRKA